MFIMMFVVMLWWSDVCSPLQHYFTSLENGDICRHKTDSSYIIMPLNSTGGSTLQLGMGRGLLCRHYLF